MADIICSFQKQNSVFKIRAISSKYCATQTARMTTNKYSRGFSTTNTTPARAFYIFSFLVLPVLIFMELSDISVKECFNKILFVWFRNFAPKCPEQIGAMISYQSS